LPSATSPGRRRVTACAGVSTAPSRVFVGVTRCAITANVPMCGNGRGGRPATEERSARPLPNRCRSVTLRRALRPYGRGGMTPRHARGGPAGLPGGEDARAGSGSAWGPCLGPARASDAVGRDGALGGRRFVPVVPGHDAVPVRRAATGAELVAER